MWLITLFMAKKEIVGLRKKMHCQTLVNNSARYFESHTDGFSFNAFSVICQFL